MIYGPAAVCSKHDAWGALPLSQRAKRDGRQGVRYPLEEGLRMMGPATMRPVPADGDIMFRGNITMKGYLKNAQAAAEAFAGAGFTPAISRHCIPTGKRRSRIAPLQKFIPRQQAQSAPAIDG